VANGYTLVALLVAALAVSQPAQPPQQDRRVPLSGTLNLRDLGGYATSDGHRVRRGVVYRSDELARLTDEDYVQIARLGITTICDFRRDGERQRAPTRWRGSDVPEILLRLPDVQLATAPDPTGTAMRGGTGEEVAASMRASYAFNVTSLAPTYARGLERIGNGGATLVHCTAGKDRTGIFSAIFLRLVGVPAATVEEDYLLSNTYYGTDARIATMAVSLKTSVDAARALLRVEPDYLASAFNQIDRKYGSLSQYRREELAMTDADLEQLKARVLEPR
jgi:protein-tyrosine phosphatase